MITIHNEKTIFHENEKIDTEYIKEQKKRTKVKDLQYVNLLFIIFNYKK